MLRLVLSAVLICTVFGVVIAQRGSSRYVPTESEYESERAPRPPVRRTSVRRARPTPAAETVDVYEKPPLQNPSRQDDDTPTARRTSDRSEKDPYAPPPGSLPLPEDEIIPFLPPTPDEPHVPVSPPENKQQGRRRKQKKRRKPQNAALHPETDSAQEETGIPQIKYKESVIELLNTDDKRSPAHHGDSGPRYTPKVANNDANLDRSSYSSNAKQPVDSSENEPYFPPQTGTNRLPLDDTHSNENSRGYSESSPIEPIREVPNRYTPPGPELNSPPVRGYVPILSPNRGSGAQSSRSSYNGFREDKRKEQVPPSTRHSRPNNRIPPPPQSNSEDYIRSAGAKPSDNAILVGNEPGVPELSHGEVRLPPTEQPLIAPEYDRILKVPVYFAEDPGSSFESDEKSVDDVSAENPRNHYSVTPEIRHEHVHSSHSDDNRKDSSTDTVPHSANRRQETRALTSRNAVSSYPQEREPPKSQRNRPVSEDDSKLSVYQPPLQRTGSRYRQDNSELQSRQRTPATPQDNSEEPRSRNRGTSRYQPENFEPESTRTRSSSRIQPEEFESGPVRTRSRSQTETSRSNIPSRTQIENIEHERSRSRISSPPQSGNVPREAQRYRGSSRYQPETLNEPSQSQSDSSSAEESTRSRSSSRSTSSRVNNQNPRKFEIEPEERDSRRTPINPEAHIDAEYSSGDRVYRQRVPASDSEIPQTQHTRVSNHNPAPAPEESEEAVPARQRLRPHPQFEAREPEEIYAYEEPVDNENVYEPEYQRPRQGNRRIPSPREEPERQVTVQRASPPRAREEVEYRAPPQRAPLSPPREEGDYRAPPQRSPISPPREEGDYRAPPQRQQPQYQAPENPRVNRRPSASQPSRSRNQDPAPQLPRSRHQEPAPQPSRSRNQEPVPSPTYERSSSGSRYRCPEPYGYFPDPVQCDKYYECRNGTAVETLCNDGLAFNEVSSPKYLRCDSLKDVDCSSRPELQEARPTKNCPRRFGLYPHETDCTKFWNCVDGTSTEVQCPPGLTFNEDKAACDWADLVKTTCTTEDLLGFSCPEPSAYDLQDGVYTTYPHPDNCQLHFACIKGEGGLRRPRLLSCNEGLVFDPQSSYCRRPDEVLGCEDFYGSRSPAPKRKSAREPLPREPEVLEDEEPTPKPRRRNQSNRRARN